MNNLDLVQVDKARFIDAIECYFLWKELDSRIRNSCSRGVNFPETISEVLISYALKFHLSKADNGDAYDLKTNTVIECKGTSNYDRDLSSFSPNDNDNIICFARLDRKNDKCYIYNTGYSIKMLKHMNINKNQTIEEQQRQGRRPRFSIIEKLINPYKLKPSAIVDLRLQTVKILN